MIEQGSILMRELRIWWTWESFYWNSIILWYFHHRTPIAQFEGILTNVERRLQLYIMVQTWAVSERWQVKFWYINLLAVWNAFPKNEDGIQIIFRNFNMTTARACIYKHEAFSTMHVQRGDVMVAAPTMNTITIR